MYRNRIVQAPVFYERHTDPVVYGTVYTIASLSIERQTVGDDICFGLQVISLDVTFYCYDLYPGTNED